MKYNLLLLLVLIAGLCSAYSIELVSNTDQCLVSCETTYKVCTGVDETANVSFGFNKKNNEYKIDDLNNKFLLKNDYLFSNVNIKDFSLNNKKKNYTVSPDKCELITIEGKKMPFEEVDNIPIINGNFHTEYIWWNSSWNYKYLINLSKPVSSGYVQDLHIDSISSLNCEADLGDLRVVWENDSLAEELPYYFVQYKSNSALVYFNTTSSTNGNYYLYCGNPLVSTSRNGFNVFHVFDDFDNGVFNTTKWNVTQTVGAGGIAGQESGYMYVVANSSGVADNDGVIVRPQLSIFPHLSYPVIQFMKLSTFTGTESGGGCSSSGDGALVIAGLGTWNGTNPGGIQDTKWRSLESPGTIEYRNYLEAVSQGTNATQVDGSVYTIKRNATMTSWILNNTQEFNKSAVARSLTPIFYSRAFVVGGGGTCIGTIHVDETGFAYWTNASAYLHSNITLLEATESLVFNSTAYMNTTEYFDINISATFHSSYNSSDVIIPEINFTYDSTMYTATLISNTSTNWYYRSSVTTPTYYSASYNASFYFNYTLLGYQTEVNGNQILLSENGYLNLSLDTLAISYAYTDSYSKYFNTTDIYVFFDENISNILYLRIFSDVSNNWSQYYETLVASGAQIDDFKIMSDANAYVWFRSVDREQNVLSNATIEIYEALDNTTNWQDWELVGRRISDMNGYVYFDIDSTKTYKLLTSKTGYNPATTEALHGDEITNVDKSNAVLLVLTPLDVLSLSQTIVWTQKYFDNRFANISVRVFNPAGSSIEINTDYRVSQGLNSRGYDSTSFRVDTFTLGSGTDFDSVGSDNITLYIYDDGTLEYEITIVYLGIENEFLSLSILSGLDENTINIVLVIFLIIISTALGLAINNDSAGTNTYMVGGILLSAISSSFYYLSIVCALYYVIRAVTQKVISE